MKKFTPEEIEKYQKLYERFINDPRLLVMKTFEQHRGSNAYEHTLKVVRRAYWIAKRWPGRLNFEDLLTGAILHDYCLYDWRKEGNLWGHGHRHPKVAARNAVRDFDVSKKVRNIIISHMWPLNCFHVHMSREAHIVSIADKIVATKEALTSRKWKEKHRAEFYPKLLKLED